jgi:methionine-rich copper-binding protein CopC
MNLMTLGAAVVVLAAALHSGPPAPALAAAELARSIPSPGSEFSEAPGRLELFFTQEIEEASLDINGTELNSEVDGEHVVASIEGLEDGDYVVSWTVTSDIDGRETSGQFQFTMAPASDGETPPEVDPESRAERVEEVGDDSRTEVLIWTTVGIGVAALLALVFFYFRTSIPTFGTTRIEGGLPPPGQSPPEESEDQHGDH